MDLRFEKIMYLIKKSRRRLVSLYVLMQWIKDEESQKIVQISKKLLSDLDDQNSDLDLIQDGLFVIHAQLYPMRSMPLGIKRSYSVLSSGVDLSHPLFEQLSSTKTQSPGVMGWLDEEGVVSTLRSNACVFMGGVGEDVLAMCSSVVVEEDGQIQVEVSGQFSFSLLIPPQYTITQRKNDHPLIYNADLDCGGGFHPIVSSFSLLLLPPPSLEDREEMRELMTTAMKEDRPPSKALSSLLSLSSHFTSSHVLSVLGKQKSGGASGGGGIASSSFEEMRIEILSTTFTLSPSTSPSHLLTLSCALTSPHLEPIFVVSSFSPWSSPFSLSLLSSPQPSHDQTKKKTKERREIDYPLLLDHLTSSYSSLKLSSLFSLLSPFSPSLLPLGVSIGGGHVLISLTSSTLRFSPITPLHPPSPTTTPLLQDLSHQLNLVSSSGSELAFEVEGRRLAIQKSISNLLNQLT